MFLFRLEQSMAWRACSPWRRKLNTHQRFALFHRNGSSSFQPAPLTCSFPNSLAHACKQLFSSTAMYACHEPNAQLYTGRRPLCILLYLININGKHYYHWLTLMESTLFTSDGLLPHDTREWLQGWHAHSRGAGRRAVLAFGALQTHQILVKWPLNQRLP